MPRRPLRFRSRDEQKAAFARMRQGPSIFSRIRGRLSRSQKPKPTLFYEPKRNCEKCNRPLIDKNRDPQWGHHICKSCGDKARKTPHLQPGEEKYIETISPYAHLTEEERRAKVDVWGEPIKPEEQPLFAEEKPAKEKPHRGPMYFSGRGAALSTFGGQSFHVQVKARSEAEANRKALQQLRKALKNPSAELSYLDWKTVHPWEEERHGQSFEFYSD